ncbi:MAG: uracil-DNA glycosylase [Lachnospiraceae bacterium]|nr:uracil-DNA glycosylase [Lachnospiraceae bacterium]
MIGNWSELIEQESQKEYYKALMSYVDREYLEHTCYPAREKIFSAFDMTPLSEVKVLILGQDPYHEENQAHGLAFSVPIAQKKLPPSLKNIFKELCDETGMEMPETGYLGNWAAQGVLLLNTVLTVREGEANSHKNRGWEIFADEVIRTLNSQDRPIVYMLWGAQAESKRKMLDNPGQLVLTGPHPSPLSAYRGFFGCGHFNECNRFLEEKGIKPVDWSI